MATPSAIEVLALDSWGVKAEKQEVTGDVSGLDICTPGMTRGSFAYGGTQRSLWHDLQLCEPGESSFSFVVEITKGTLCKGEVTLDKESNPVEENAKATAKLEKFNKPVPFNYGIFPRTFCHPQDKAELGHGGDSAPLDVVELSGEPLEVGSIHEVEVQGAFCVLDKSELDWKILVVRSDKLAAWSNHGALLLGAKLKQEVDTAMQWFFDWYDFKGKAEFPYGKVIFPMEEALKRVHRAHHGWRRLLKECPSGFWLSPSAKRQLDIDNSTSNRRAKKAQTNKKRRVSRPGEL